MIDTEALRKKVIDLAIRGKLTEQLPSDGDAETLYAQIQDNKLQLIEEGKIKKDKAFPNIAEDEIPFEIPGNWKWCRLGEVYNVLMGQSPDGMNVGTDIDGLEFHQGKIYFGEKFLRKSEQKSSELTRVADENSVLLCVRAPVGVVNITERNICIGRGLCALKALANMEPYYLFYYLLSCRKSFENSGTGSTFSSITVDVVKKHLIPLPPPAEQKRIVEVLDNVFNQFAVIDDLQAKYSNDLAVLKSKIIDAGIQGKLTEQLPEDGDAEDLYKQIQEKKERLIKEGKIKKEKTLPDIVVDEIPFVIPKNWKWVRLASLYEINPRVEADAETMAAFVPMEKISAGFLKDFTYDEQKWYIASKNHTKFQNDDVAFAKISPCFENRKSFIAKELPNGIGGGTTELIVLRQKDIYPEYTYYLITSQRFIDAGSMSYRGIVGQQRIKSDVVNSFLVPLPPYAEQIRIAEKINEVLGYLNK